MTGAPPDAAGRWVLRRHARPDARLRLLCLPHAGGDTWMFADWHNALPPSIDVCPIRLPGRGSRIADPAIADLDALVAALVDGLSGLLDRPFAVFGHSMGALIGVTLARALARERGLSPVLFCAAACRAPHLVGALAPISQLPDHLLLAAMQRRYGRPLDFADNPDLLRLVLPTLRADLSLCETPMPSRRDLACPIVAYGGRHDASVDAAALDGWEDHTSGAFRYHVVDGDHFFPIGAKAELLPVLAEDLGWAMS